MTNGRPSLRVDDQGIHAACCGPNIWTAKTGSATVLINGRPAHRQTDRTQHCGGMGQLLEGSANVIVGDLSSSGAGGGGSGSPSSESAPAPAAQSSATPAPQPQAAAPAEPKTPKKAPAKWNLVYADGRPVRGFRSRMARATVKEEQDVSPDGQGQHEIVSMDEEERFSVVPIGTEQIQGQVLDSEGKPVVGAEVQIDRAYGPPVDAVTDGSGRFKAPGLLEQEPFEAIVRYPATALEGRFTDEKGKPVPVRASLWIERSRIVDLPVAEDGKYRLDGAGKGAPYELLFVASKLAAEGRVVDELGRPLSGVRMRARLSGNRVVDCVSDGSGTYRITGVMPEEAYSLEILSGFPAAK